MKHILCSCHNASQARFAMEFCAIESCGKCTPCREGTQRLLEMMGTGSEGTPIDWTGLGGLAEVINAASLCGLGQAAGNPVLSYNTYFQ